MNEMSKIETRSFFDDWAKARKLLLPALDLFRGSLTENDVIAGLLAGRYRLWLNEKSAFVTSFEQVNSFMTLNVVICGGDREEICATEDELVICAKANGCKWVSGRGREGWRKDAASHGWKLDYIAIYKEV